MKHKIEVPDWKYEILDYYDNPNIFLKDPKRDKYNIMDTLEIKEVSSDKVQKRIVKSILFQDEGMKKNYVMLTLGKKANFDGCIITAVFDSLGTSKEEVDKKIKNIQ